MSKPYKMRLKQKHFKTLFGLLLLPVMTATFLIDRFVLIFLPWVEGTTIQKYVFERKQIGNSLYRVIVGIVVFLIIKMFV